MYRCEFCDAKYVSESGFYKHRRNKHSELISLKKTKSVYFCNSCDVSFNVKKKLIQHVKCHVQQKSRGLNIICSFEHCLKSFYTMAGYILHLKSYHEKKIESEVLNFDSMEGNVIL